MASVMELANMIGCDPIPVKGIAGSYPVARPNLKRKVKMKEIKREVYVCSHCQNKVKEQIDCNPTWYGTFRKEDPLEIICIDCWDKGIRHKHKI